MVLPVATLSMIPMGIDWIEVPPADAINSLKAASFQISLWPYPHTWPYVLNVTGQSPFRDKLVRQADNYVVDREGLVKLLNGTAIPAPGLYPTEHRVFGEPKNRYAYDPFRGLAPRPPFTIRSQKNSRRTAQADDCVGCGPQTHTAPEKAKDSERADNQRNRAQYDARQAR